MRNSHRETAKKGLVLSVALFMIAGLILVISAWIFFVGFKVHLTSLAVDADSINRYQEIPTTALLSSFFVSESCFKGNGPLGEHGANHELCTKGLAFFLTRELNDLSKTKLEDTNSDEGRYPISAFREDLKLSLPSECYDISFEHEGAKSTLMMDAGVIGSNCNLAQPKLKERYPVPVFFGGPSVAQHVITIGTSLTSGQEILVNWPRYELDFRIGGDRYE